MIIEQRMTAQLTPSEPSSMALMEARPVSQ